MYKFILINGYGWSGSSALVDFFKEFEEIYVPEREFRLIKDPHGLRDLDMQINNSIDPLNEDNAIREFLEFVKVYARPSGKLKPMGLAYKSYFGEEIENISKEFINELCDYRYAGYWWYLDKDTSGLKYFLLKVLKRVGLYNHQEHTKMNLVFKSEAEFIELARKYIEHIFYQLLKSKKEKYKTIVLDQAIPANRSEWGERYFKNCKILVVDRDPRDVYIDLINAKSLVGYDVAVNHDVWLFVEWFRKVRMEKNMYRNDNLMRIRFEDLILDYENVTSQICNFCDIDLASHSAKRKRLNPEISKQNIGMWKSYKYQNEIKIIERELMG